MINSTETTLNIFERGLEVVMAVVGRSERSEVPARNVILLGLLLALLQALDGILTSLGISRFGIDMEGNPLLRSLMLEFGHVPTLAVIKTLAIALVVGLTLLAKSRPWVTNAMGAICCVYFVAAVIPWTYFLFVKF